MKRLLLVLSGGVLGALLLFGIEIGGYADFLLRSSPANPASGKARLFIGSATRILTCLLSDGTSCMPTITAAPFQNYLNTGSVLVTDFGVSSSGFTRWPGGSSDNGCATNTAHNFWPAAGYVRHTTMTTSTVSPVGIIVRGGYLPDCLTGFIGGFQYGAFIPDNAAAGSFVDQSEQATHMMQGGLIGFAFQFQNMSLNPASVTAMAAEFVADTGYVTVFPSGGGTGGTASATRYFGAYGKADFTTETDVAIPMPVAGTASALWWCPGASAITNIPTMTLRKSAVNTSVTASPAASAGAVIECTVDVTHTVSYAAGDYLDFGVVTGAGTVPPSGQYGIMYTAASGTATIVSGMIAGTVSTTANYNLPGSSRTSTSQAGVELGLPMPCVASKLYVVQSSANGVGVTTTFTLQLNGANTAVTGTITSASGTGALLLDNTHTVTFARGDLMQMKYSTGSGTSGTMGGWSIACN